MDRYIIITLLILLSVLPCRGTTRTGEDVVQRLKRELKNKDSYSDKKIEKMESLKELLSDEQDIQLQYNINQRLIDEYWKFQIDSAIRYAQDNRRILQELKNKELEISNMIQLAWLYSAKGMFNEAKGFLNRIDPTQLPNSEKEFYYETQYDFYSHTDVQHNTDFYDYRKTYRDTLLSVLDENLPQHKLYHAQILYYDLEEFEKAKEILLPLFNESEEGDPYRAIVAYLLGAIYKDQGNTQEAINYYAASAIEDIVSATKDNASFHNLAMIYFNLGDTNLAYSLIEAALNDAMFCGVFYRTVKSSELYPIISSNYQAKEHAQKQKLMISLLIIVFLFSILALVVLYTIRQMRKLSQTKSELYLTNDKLYALNDDLQEMNLVLAEANHVKEEYIARFFDICSEYIDKLENYRLNLYSKLKENNTKELSKIIRSTNIVQSEVEELYENFDMIFLNIYPTFVDEFNELLKEGEEIEPRSELSLNTELRIYALIRLGITDSVQIANFLRYSVRTVYNYRTKVRNKSAVPRDEFEDMVARIGTFKEVN